MNRLGGSLVAMRAREDIATTSAYKFASQDKQNSPNKFQVANVVQYAAQKKDWLSQELSMEASSEGNR